MAQATALFNSFRVTAPVKGHSRPARRPAGGGLAGWARPHGQARGAGGALPLWRLTAPFTPEYFGAR